MADRFAQKLFLVWLAGFAVLVGATLWLTGGRLIFPLDDPYIHLATAENILRGTYGINLGEPASASSSILFPFLVAITQALGLGEVGPIWLTAPAAALTVLAFGGLIAGVIPPGWMRWGTALPGLFVLSAFALPMTGIEHSLHVMLSLLAMLGLIAMTRGEAPGWRLGLIIVLLPLIRFEGAGLAGMIILFEYLWGYRRAAIIQVTALAAAFAVYALVMQRLGLPVLPSSVMVKATLPDAMAAEASGGISARIAEGFASTFRSRQGTMLVLLAWAVGMAWLALGRRKADLPIAATAIACLLGHAAAGHIGAFGRYEVYVITIGLVGLLWLCRPALQRGSLGLGVALVVGTVVLAEPYARVTWLTPWGSQNILDQHVQMHDLIVDHYRGDVAVHDIGWPAYRNDDKVLDLWGLASEEVRQMRATNYVLSPAQLRDLVTRHRIGLVMVYEDVFRDTPAEWVRVARMTSAAVTAGRATVSIFATSAAEASRVRAAVEGLEPNLPGRVTLDWD